MLGFGGNTINKIKEKIGLINDDIALPTRGHGNCSLIQSEVTHHHGISD